MELAMLENNNTNTSPRAVVRGYGANNPSPIQMTSYYNRQLENTPMDTYEVAGQYALEDPQQANQPISTWSDAWKAFNNSRDEINLMSERSIITREIDPELEQINNSLSNAENLTDDEITDLQNRRDELLEKRAEVSEEIESLHKDIKDRGKLSPMYQALQWQTEKNQPSIFSGDYLRYSVPSTLGSSFSTVVQYGTALGALALRTAAKGLITAAAGSAAVGTGGALTPLAIAAAVDTGIAAADLATTWYTRRRESLAQAYGAYKDRLDNDLKKRYGVGLEQYVEQGRQQLMQSMNPNDVQQMSDNEIIDRILTGQIQIPDENLKQLSDAAKHGSDVVYNRNMALSLIDIGQTALISNPIARGLKNIISRPIGKALSPITKAAEPVTKKMNKLVDNYIGWNARLNLNKPLAGVVLKSAKDLGKYGIAAVGEAFEEGAQDVFDADYIKGLYDDKSAGFLSSVTGLMDANYRVAKILSGIDTESELAKDPQFWTDVKAGFALGMYMGAGPAVANSIVGTIKQVGANRMVRDISIENMQRKDTMEKVKAYADRAAKRRFNYDQEVLDTLEAYKRTLPEGVTEEDVDAEINLAKQVFNAVGNPEVRAMARYAGFEPGSPEFSAYIALAHDAREEVKRSAESVVDSADKLQKSLSDLTKDFESLGLSEEDAATERELTMLNGRRSVLESLEEEIESENPNLRKFGITSKDHPLAKSLKAEIKNELKEIDKRTTELANDKYSEDFYRPTEHAQEAAAKYLGLLISNINHDAVSKEADMMNGMYGTDGKKVRYFRKLNEEDKKKVGNVIKNKVNTYLKNLEETQAATTAEAEKMAGQTPKPTTAEQVSPSEEPRKGKSYDDTIPTETEETQEEAQQPKTQQPSAPITPEPTASEPTRQPVQEPAEEEVSQEELAKAEEAVKKAREQKEVTSRTPEVKPDVMPEVTVDDVESDTELTELPIDETVEEANARLNVEDELAAEKTFGDKEEEASAKIDRESAFQAQDGLNVESSLALEGLEVTDRISNVFFYNPQATKPMLPGYKPGKDLAKLLEKPGVLTECTFRFFIDESYTESGYKKPYKKGDPSTYDAATIMLEISHPTGKYLVALKTPNSAKLINDSEGAIEALTNNRKAIIEAIENKGPNQEVIPVNIHMSNGVYNQNVSERDGVRRPVFRPISQVPTIELDAERFVIGKGTLGNFELFDKFGQVRPGHGGNGQLFYMAKPSQTLSGRELPIQMNVQRFSNILARSIARLFIESSGSTRYLTDDGRIDASEVVNFLVYNGRNTLINSNDSRMDFLINKQLGFDDQGMLHVGRNVYNPVSITEEQMDEIVDTMTNMHFSIDKNNFWGSMRDALPSVAEYFDITNADEVMVLPGITFTREQFTNPEYTVFNWYVDNNFIHTDIKDEFFTDGFVYFNSVATVDVQSVEPKALETTAQIAEKFSEVEGKSTEIINSSTGTESTPVDTTVEGEPNPFLENARKGIDPLNIFGDNYDPGFDPGQPRKLKQRSTNKKVSSREVKWFKDKLGLAGENLEFVDQAIALGNNEYAMGLCKLYSTILWTGAESGTLYHEAFHKVSLLLLSPKERNQIYQMYRNRTGFVGDNNEIEELLAEEFRQYMLDRTEHPLNLVKRMFRVIRNFINRWFNRSDYNIQKLFERINKGYYRDRSMNSASVNEWLDRFTENGGAPFKYKGHEFKHISNNQIKETIRSLASAALIYNNVRLIGDVNKINLNRIKQSLDPRVSQALVEQGKLTPQQAEVRDEIFDTFDTIFKDEIVKNLNNLKIKVSDNTELMDQETENKADGAEVGDEMAKHILQSYEVSTKDNALTTVKVFVSCLPNLDFVDGDPNRVVPVLNQATGLPTTVPYDVAWSAISTELAKARSFNDMLEISAEQAKINPIFKALYTELMKLNAPIENESEASKIARENLKTQIENTFKKHLSNFLSVITTENTDERGNKQIDILLVNENANKRVNEMLAGWLNELIHNTGLVKINSNGSYIVDKDVEASISKLSNKFNEFIKLENINNITDENLANSKNYLLSLLSEMGIPVDIDSLNALLQEMFYNQSPAESFKSLLKDTTSNGIRFVFINKLNDLRKLDEFGNIPNGRFNNPISRLYHNSIFIKKLAELYCKNHPIGNELTALATDKKLFYIVTESNYLTDFTSDLNDDKELVQQLADVMYVGGDNSNTKNYIKGSVVLNNLAKGKKLSVETLVGFRHSGTDDVGRKYTQISALENYVMRMALLRANKLILPTMGDSGRYDVLSGSAVSNFNRKINADFERGKISFDDQVLRRFVEYFETELDTIEYNYNNPPQTPQETVKNYDTGARNGYRFRNFDGVNLMGLTNDKAGMLNETLAEAEKIDKANNDPNYTEAKNVIRQFRERWNSLRFREKADLMDDYLKDVFVRKELAYAKELGLIEFDGKHLLSVKNVAIPSQWVSNAAVHYSGKYANQLGILEVMMNMFANNIYSKIEFNKLYTKDPAYYKNETDMIKRLREVLSTGVKPRLDYEDNPEMQDLTELNVATFNDNVIVSRQFDSIKASAAKSFLYKLLQNNGLTAEEAQAEIANNGEKAQAFADLAKQMANNRFKGYGEVNQTDATVLISPEGYKQLVRRIDGWTPDVEKAFNILNNADILTSDDPTLYQDALNTLIKPLKVMYFGGTVNTRLKREVPIFDKMALFPVFPVIATGDMKHVLDAMQKQNVHMIAFESAVKVGQDKNTDLYNSDGSINIEGINNLPYHKQPLKYFRRQLITDPHDAAHDQMFVSQAQKAMMLNIRHRGTYTLPDGSKVSGRELLGNVTGSIDALTLDGEREFNDKFGVHEDENGNRVADKSRTFSELRKSAERSNMNQNVIEGLSDSSTPLSALSDNSWMEASLISGIGKDVIDIKTPGGMFIQMSSIAYNDTSVTSSRNLKFDNEDGSLECVISINLLKNIIPDYDKKSFKESKEWLIKNGLIGSNTQAMAIGYRIPAQGPSSVAALKVVDVYPENIGDTITLPDEWTALTGSDRHIIVRTSII